MPLKNWEGKTLGGLLKVGDTIQLNGRTVRIVEFEDYRGPVAERFTDGARIATFDIGGGMTVDNAGWY